MDNKIKKDLRRILFGTVLCLSLVLGMSISMVKMVSAGSRPTTFDLGAKNAYISTTDRIIESGSDTYVVGTIEMGSSIQFVSGVEMNVTFDRPIGTTQATANGNGEWFEFLNCEINNEDDEGLTIKIGDKNYNYLVNFMAPGNVGGQVTTYEKYVAVNKYYKGAAVDATKETVNVPFIILLHNVKDNLNITYELLNDKMSYYDGTDDKGAASDKYMKHFDGSSAKIAISPTSIKLIELSWNPTNIKDPTAPPKYCYPLGGKNASASAVQDGKKCGGWMDFTLKIGDKLINTADRDTLSDEDKAIVDKVSFTFAYAVPYKTKLVGKLNNEGEKYRVVDIQTGGFALARYSGVVKATLSYPNPYESGVNHTSSNQATVVVPGDLNGDGWITTSDLSDMAQLLRGTLNNGPAGSVTEHLSDVADSNGDGIFMVSDLRDNAARIRKEDSNVDLVKYNTEFRPVP